MKRLIILFYIVLLATSVRAQEMKKGQRIEDVFINTRNRVREASSGRQNPQEWSQLTGSENKPAEKLKLKEFGRKKGFYLGEKKLRNREVAVYLRTTNSQPIQPILNTAGKPCGDILLPELVLNF